MTEDELMEDVRHWKGRAVAAEAELPDWKQAASVEAGLRREYIAKTDALVKALEEIVSIGGKTGYGKMALVRVAKVALNAVVSSPLTTERNDAS